MISEDFCVGCNWHILALRTKNLELRLLGSWKKSHLLLWVPNWHCVMPPFQRLYGNARAHRSPPDGKNCVDRCVKGSRYGDHMGIRWWNESEGHRNQRYLWFLGYIGIPVFHRFWLVANFAGKKTFKEDSSKKMIDPLLGIYLGPLVP